MRISEQIRIKLDEDIVNKSCFNYVPEEINCFLTGSSPAYRCDIIDEKPSE